MPCNHLEKCFDSNAIISSWVLAQPHESCSKWRLMMQFLQLTNWPIWIEKIDDQQWSVSFKCLTADLAGQSGWHFVCKELLYDGNVTSAKTHQRINLSLLKDSSKDRFLWVEFQRIDYVNRIMKLNNQDCINIRHVILVISIYLSALA